MHEEKLAALAAHEAYSTAKHTKNVFFTEKEEENFFRFFSSFNDGF
jgi:hypothetical protein